MLKMGCIIAAEVYKEDNPTSVGLLIPYKAIQFDNPIFTKTNETAGQIRTMSTYDMFVGVEYSFYKAIVDENKEIKQVLPNDDAEPMIASFNVGQGFNGSNAIKIVGVDYFTAPDAQITYEAFETNIPDEIEEVLRFGGKGWFLENKG